MTRKVPVLSLPRYYDNFNVFTGSSSATISNPVILSGGAVEVTNNKAVTRNAGATAWADTRSGKASTRFSRRPPATQTSPRLGEGPSQRRGQRLHRHEPDGQVASDGKRHPRVHLTGT